ncbi:Peroxisomal membrane signal receptor PTS1 [Rhodotorula kratochvilovae]
MSAFSAMMGGAECSTSSNPLSSLLKQQQADHSLHHQSYAPGGGSSQGASMRSFTGTPTGQLQGDEADRFFQQHHAAPPAAGPLAMDAMRRELESVSRGSTGPIKGDREWASQYHPAGSSLSPADMARMEEQFRMQQHQGMPSEFSAEFRQQQHFPTASGAGPAFAPAAPAPTASSAMYSRPGFAPSYGSYGGGMMGGMRSFGAPPVLAPAAPQQAGAKGKGRFVELDDADWETHFARVGEAEAATKEAPAEAAQASDQANVLDGEIDLDASESDAQLLKDLESTWSSLKGQLNASNAQDAELAQWEAQYGSQFNDIHGSPLLDDDDDLFGDGTPDVRRAPTWTRENVDAFLQDQSAFPYNEENDYMQHADPYAEGMRLLAEGAPLSEAALAFEAACRQDETRGEAWKAAGETWAADEREVKGIRALEKAVACGGAAGVAAWLSLAVAYVNEGQELRALATLEKWLSLAYPSISLPPLDSSQMRSPWDASNRVIDLFLAAAQAGPQSRAPGQSDELGIVDPDVQVGLGVLFYSNSEYDKAKDCFEAALSVRPNDFLLWNRLGATLANSGHPETAIDAYRRALDLRPTFTRATYNLGVSCLNIGCYHEAAEHLLAALQGQMTREEAASGGKGRDSDLGRIPDGSENLWHTLRRAFLCMVCLRVERHDLADKAMPGASLDTFRAEGFEF